MQPSSETSHLAIGNKIRALRQRLKRTLDETASAAGISKGFLSQVERGHATPSLNSLRGIASALGASLPYFVGTPSEAQSVRRGEQLSFFGFTDSPTRFARLTSETAGRQLETLLVQMAPGQPHTDVATDADEEFIYVLSGEVSLTIEGETFTLKTGDSAHFSSMLPHSWANAAAAEALVVWVGTPRLF
jgi:transcriptional regulator with XRE-family HTH domain